jgi:hypothetical protein
VSGLSLGLVVAGAVIVGTVILAVLGILIDRSAARYEREGMR